MHLQARHKISRALKAYLHIHSTLRVTPRLSSQVCKTCGHVVNVRGLCLQVAAGMMAGCLPAGSCAARIMLFAGGPPTVGSGKVVDMELQEPIRQATVAVVLPWGTHN